MKNYSYVTLLTTDNYVQGVVLLKASLERVGAKYPLSVMITDNLSEKTLTVLESLKVNVIPVKKLATPEKLYEKNKTVDAHMADVWKDVLTKFQVWQLTQFDKVIMLDCDLLFLKNPDDCFEKPEMTAALDGEYFNLWYKWPHFNTGFFVVKPSLETFNKIVDFATNIDKYRNLDEILDYQGHQYVIADQELLNLYFKDWPKQTELHLSKFYNIFSPHIAKGLEDEIEENGYFIHFTGDKPWFIDDKQLSVLRTKSGWNYLSCYFLEIAAAMIEAEFSSGFTMNWQDIDLNKFYLLCAQLALYRFRDAENVEKFVNKITNTKTFSEQDNTCYDQVRFITKAIKRAEKIQPLIEYMYKEGSKPGKQVNTPIELYKYLAVNEKMLEFPSDYLLSIAKDINTVYDSLYDVIVNVLKI